MPQSSMSMKEFADFIRGSVANVPQGISDEDIVRQVMTAAPAKSDIPSVMEPRREMKSDQPTGFDRFAQGVAAVPTSMYQSFERSMHPGAPDPKTGLYPEPTQKDFPKFGENIASAVDAPGIKQDWTHQNKLGAAGRATTQAALWALPFSEGMRKLSGAREASANKAAFKELDEAGQQRSGNWAEDNAKSVMRPQAKMLDSQITDIKASMQHETIDSAKLTSDIAWDRGVVKKINKIADASVKDVSASKEAVNRLDQRLKANPKTMSWTDAYESLKEIGNAKASLGKGSSALKTSLTEIEQGLDKQLQESAQKAGQGKAFSDYRQNYRSLNNLYEIGAKTFKEQTVAQKTAKMTAKGGVMGVRIPKVGSLQLGPDKEVAVAKSNQAALKRWHGAVSELDRRIRQSASPESDIEQARRQR